MTDAEAERYVKRRIAAQLFDDLMSRESRFEWLKPDTLLASDMDKVRYVALKMAREFGHT